MSSRLSWDHLPGRLTVDGGAAALSSPDVVHVRSRCGAVEPGVERVRVFVPATAPAESFVLAFADESDRHRWGEGAYFLVVGTKDMERAAWAWLDELGYSRRLLSGSARWAPFVPA